MRNTHKLGKQLTWHWPETEAFLLTQRRSRRMLATLWVVLITAVYTIVYAVR